MALGDPGTPAHPAALKSTPSRLLRRVRLPTGQKAQRQVRAFRTVCCRLRDVTLWTTMGAVVR